MKTTMHTRWFGETVAVSANWAQAADQIEGLPGFQVADFRHRPERALEAALEDIAKAEGLDVSEKETRLKINRALRRAVWDDYKPEYHEAT
jgi:hypothetical protein